MILCLEGDKLGKVRDLYFLSVRAKNGIKNHNFLEAALRRTNLLFLPTSVSINKLEELNQELKELGRAIVLLNARMRSEDDRENY